MKDKKNTEPYIDINALEEIIQEKVREIINNMDLRCNRRPLFFTISVKIEPSGKIYFESFGNVNFREKIRNKNNIAQTNRWLSDIIENEKEYLVVIDAKGFEDNDFFIKLRDNKLVVELFGEEKIYREFHFDKPVLQEFKKIFKNGILEIAVPKQLNNKLE